MTATPSRRLVLAAAATLPVAACTRSRRPPARLDPDDALRAAAVERERALIALYAAAPASPARVAVRAEHEVHLAALLGAAPSSTPTNTPASTAVSAATTPQLVAAERVAAAAHAVAALSASRPLAAVLASLASSEASHPIALT